MRASSTAPSHMGTAEVTSSVAEVIRPEARRAYPEGSGASSSSKSKLQERSSKTSNSRVSPGREEESIDKILLQQAAAYAPLASLSGAGTRRSSSLRRVKDSSMTSPDDQDSIGGEPELTSDYHAGASNDVVGGEMVANPSSKTIRPSRFFNLSRSKKQNASLPSSSHLYPRAFRKDHRDDVESHEVAPRLSISSTEESSNGSEIKTPESFTDSMGWSRALIATADVEANQGNTMKQVDESLLQDMTQHPLSSPPLIDLSTGLNEAELTGEARSVREEEVDPALVEAALNLESYSHHHEAEDGMPIYNDDTDSLSPFDKSRGSTIRAKRPNVLLRLPSARTDDTARPSPPSTSVSSAAPTPAATSDNAFGKSSDPMDDAMSSLAREQSLSMSPFEEPIGSPLGHFSGPPSFESVKLRSRSSTAEGVYTDARDRSSDSRSGVASPDSWRSLLPEHDPYFISNEALSYRSSSRTQSLSGIAGRDTGASSMLHSSSEGQGNSGVLLSQVLGNSLNDRESRRLSTESMQSSFSHGNQPLAASIYASSNASGSLYDMDGTFNSSGSRAAFAPLAYQYNHSTKSLASPSLSSTINAEGGLRTQEPLPFDSKSSRTSNDQPNYDLSSSSALQSAAARRHASFSAFDNTSIPSPSFAPLMSPRQPFIHPDHHDRARVMGGNSRSQSIVASETSPERRQSIPLGQSTRLGSMQSKSKISPSSPTSYAMGNEGERESWPTSRRISPKRQS